MTRRGGVRYWNVTGLNKQANSAKRSRTFDPSHNDRVSKEPPPPGEGERKKEKLRVKVAHS